MDSITPSSRVSKPGSRQPSPTLTERLRQWISVQYPRSFIRWAPLSPALSLSPAKIVPCEEDGNPSALSARPGTGSDLGPSPSLMSAVVEVTEQLAELPQSGRGGGGELEPRLEEAPSTARKGEQEGTATGSGPKRGGRSGKGRKFEVSGEVEEQQGTARGDGEGGRGGKKAARIIQSTSAFATVSTPETEKERRRREKKERKVREREEAERSRREEEAQAEAHAQSWPAKLFHSLAQFRLQVFEATPLASRFQMRAEPSSRPNEVQLFSPLPLPSSFPRPHPPPPYRACSRRRGIPRRSSLWRR
jgi:hypothetical protein